MSYNSHLENHILRQNAYSLKQITFFVLPFAFHQTNLIQFYHVNFTIKLTIHDTIFNVTKNMCIFLGTFSMIYNVTIHDFFKTLVFSKFVKTTKNVF